MRSQVCLFGFVLAVAYLLTTQPCPAQDKVIGAVWEIKFGATNPKNEMVRKFRATPDGKVWNMPVKEKPRVIGKWSGDETDTTMEIDALGDGGGKYEIVQVGKNPPTWQGTVKNANGSTRPVKVRLIKD